MHYANWQGSIAAANKQKPRAPLRFATRNAKYATQQAAENKTCALTVISPELCEKSGFSLMMG